ncbi:MAG: tail fiber protein [Pseudomonadota bacterium]
MSEPFIAEIRIFGGSYAPRGWAFCDGQLLPIATNTALFSLIGTIYGGDGRTTFALPNMQGRIPLGAGRGTGLSERQLSERGGAEETALTLSQIPSHNHAVLADANPGSFSGGGADTADPNNHFLAATTSTGPFYGDGSTNRVAMAPTSATGGAAPHNNDQPFLVLNYIIALEGLYPTPN